MAIVKVNLGIVHDMDLADRAARYYDLFSERDDVEFFVSLAGEHGGPVLDVGCGAGRIAVEIARAGVHVDGFDLSEQMLRIAEEKRAALSADDRDLVRFFRQDM